MFPLRYRPMASVQRALAALRREHRKPIFAVRDFNLDPLLLQKTFGVSAEGFQFPSSAERYRISGIPASAGSPAAGMMAQDGLDTLVDFAECGTKLHSYGRVCAWCCVICAALGAILAVVGVCCSICSRGSSCRWRCGRCCKNNYCQKNCHSV